MSDMASLPYTTLPVFVQEALGQWIVSLKCAVFRKI